MTAGKSPKFVLKTGSHLWNVTSFTIKNLGISREYEIHLIIQDEDVPRLINQPASVYVDAHIFHGFIVSQQVSHSEQIVRTSIQLVSPLKYYLSHSHTQIFKEQHLPSIIRKLLVNAGLTEGAQFELRLKSEAKDWWFYQDNESTLLFLRRILAAHCLYYSYQQTEDHARCIIADSLETLLPAGLIALKLQPHSGFARQEGISVLTFKQHLCTGTVTRRNFAAQSANYTTKEASSACKTALGKYETNGYSPSQGAIVKQAMLDEAARQVTLQISGMPLLPGHEVNVESDEFNGRVRVCALEIRGFQEKVKGAQKIEEHLSFHEERLHTKAVLSPFFSGLAPISNQIESVKTKFDTAQIEHRPGIYPDISETGSYHIRLHQDIMAHGDGKRLRNEKTKASPWVRAASYFAGNHYGFNFPLHDESEALIAYENGNMQSPVIIGALSNSDCPSVVTSANPDEKMIATRAGNQLKWLESGQENSVELSSKLQKNRLSIKEQGGSKEITLESQEGSLSLYTANVLNINTSQNYQKYAKNMLRLWGRGDLNGSSTNIVFKAQESLSLSSDQDASFHAPTQSLQAQKKIKSKSVGSTVLKAGQNLRFSCSRGNQSLQAHQGNIFIAADTSLTIKTGNASLLVTSNSMRLHTGGNLMIHALATSGLEPFET